MVCCRQAVGAGSNQQPTIQQPQERFLAKVHDCSEALRFARLMAGQYTTGALGCLAGILGCAGVWSGCLLVLGSRLDLWGWIGVAAGGLMTGSLLSHLLWLNRDRRWVKEVLIPEAQRSGICLGWLLTVLESGGDLKRVEDELRRLRELAPAIRAELTPLGDVGDEAGFGFGAQQHPFPPHSAKRE
jgi:hypothetical protein